MMVSAVSSYAVSCPGTPEAGSPSASYMWGHLGQSGTNWCYANEYQGGGTYDALATGDFDVERRFMILFPDAAPRDGTTNPARAIFLPSGGTSRSTISTATCLGGTVSGVGSALVSITLSDGSSCPLRLVSHNGVTDITYTATLSRSGSVYWATFASLTGGVFGVADTMEPRVSSINRRIPLLSPTNADTLTWRVTFDESVQNVDALDFTRTGTTASLAVAEVNVITYDVTLSGGDLADLNGTVTLSLAAGQDIRDLAGNYLTNSSPTGLNNNTYVVDNTAAEIDVQRPSGTSIADGGVDAQGSQNAGSQVTLVYSVSNTGDAPLSVSNITSTSPSNVSIDSIWPTTLSVPAGGEGTFSVAYTPTGEGAFSFNLDISNSDADEGNYDVTVSGTGVVIIRTVTPHAWANGSVSPNTPQPVNQGSTVVFEVTADTGFIQERTVGGTCPDGSWAGDDYTTGVIENDCTVEFSFLTAHTVVATAAAGGAALLQNSMVGDGDDAFIEVIADVNHTRSDVVGGTCSPGSWRGGIYTTGPVTADCSVDFYFVHDTLCMENAGSVTINSDTFFGGEEIGCYTDVPIVLGPDITIEGGAMLSLVSSASVRLVSEFTVAPGAIFEVIILP